MVSLLFQVIKHEGHEVHIGEYVFFPEFFFVSMVFFAVEIALCRQILRRPLDIVLLEGFGGGSAVGGPACQFVVGFYC